MKIQFSTPYGDFVVHKGSWLNHITGADGTTLPSAVNLRNLKSYGTRFLAHEIGHAVRFKGKSDLSIIWKYLTSKTFRETEEKAAEEFSKNHFMEPWVSALKRQLEAV